MTSFWSMPNYLMCDQKGRAIDKASILPATASTDKYSIESMTRPVMISSPEESKKHKADSNRKPPRSRLTPSTPQHASSKKRATTEGPPSVSPRTLSIQKRKRDHVQVAAQVCSGTSSSKKKLKRTHSLKKKNNGPEPVTANTAVPRSPPMLGSSKPERHTTTAEPALESRHETRTSSKTPTSSKYKQGGLHLDKPREDDAPIGCDLPSAACAFKAVRIPGSTSTTSAKAVGHQSPGDDQKTMVRRSQPFREVKVVQSIEHQVDPHNPNHTPYPWDDPVVSDSRGSHNLFDISDPRNGRKALDSQYPQN